MPAKKAKKKTPASSRKTKAKTAIKKSRSQASGKGAKKAPRVKAAGPVVLLVNMIPKSLSGESNQDSEPTIAVNPANPLQIAASAFTPDPLKGSFAPIIVYQRNANWTTNTLLGVDNTKPVGISIDPFFFKVT